ncbi:MAG: hypothetical protein U0Q11_01740 [Vicinamibacterales bacterium]
MSTELSRAQFLRLTASALPALLWSTRASAQPFDPDRRERIADIFRMYHLQGSHRTASDVDGESGVWLAEEATRLGATVTPRSFTVSRVDLQTCVVQSGGESREGVPFFDGGFTGADGVRGTLGAPGSGAPIVLTTLDQAAISSEGQSIAELRRAAGTRAIVAITDGGEPGLCPSNARAFKQPYGVPVLQVSSTAREWLEGLVKSGAEVRVVAHATRANAIANNIVAMIRGQRPELAPVVVMTPRSGWWQCVSERGGGLACWLEIMRAAARAKPARTIRFIASSGHELGHLGLEMFLEQEAALIKGASAWIHLGANIGAAKGRLRLQASADDIEALGVEALSRAGATLDGRVPRGTVPSGEARNIHVGGGRYVSMLGSGPYFHNPLDLWPTAVDLDAVTRYADAATQLALTLARA